MKRQRGFSPLFIIIGILVLGLIILAEIRVFRDDSSETTDTQIQPSPSSLKEEQRQAPEVITNETAEKIAQGVQGQDNTESGLEYGPRPTYDAYGPSTKLDRPDVHAVNLSLYPIYSKYLFDLQSVSQDKRQAVSNQYITDNKNYFSIGYYDASVSSTANLSLLHQSPDMPLPTTLSIGSAIVDPDDPTRVLAQILMEPNVSWSIIVSVKMKDHLGNFGTIESTYIRQNRNPL